MSVIQKIRDKYARVAVIAIGLALLGFILMDALSSRGGLGSNDTTLGKINGKKIDYETFNRRVQEITQRPGNQGQDINQQVVNGLWQQEIMDMVMGEQYEELGLTFSQKERDMLLFGQNPPQEFRQYIYGQQADQQAWDPNYARQQVSAITKSGNPLQKEELNQLLEYIERQQLMTKYQSLITNSVYVPKWFLEKRNVDNSQMANGAFVAVPYTSIADSTVKVTDADINDYVKAHRKEYELKEENRSMSYVQFNLNPSSADSAAVRERVLALRDSFQATSDAKEFLINNRSLSQYNDVWVAKSDFASLQNADSIFGAPTGAVVGPVVENGIYLMSKILDRKTQPDTAKVRHILIGTVNPQTGAQTRDSVAAKKLADSVRLAIAAGTPFDSLLAVSEDPGKIMNNGVYDSITRSSGMVQEFKDFALNNPVGTKGVVKTSFGYHYMEVLNQRGNSPVFKLAFYVQPIEASNETIAQANNEASMLAGNAKDEKSFNEYFEKNLKAKGYNKAIAPNLKPMDYNVMGITGSARELVRDVFEAEKGDVLSPHQVGNNAIIVAIVTDVVEPGLPSASAVRQAVEPVLVNKKKAEQIKKQMGTVSDLNAVASKFNQQVQPADSVRFSGGGPLGYEMKVVGAMFNPGNKGKVVAEGIAGQMGVYAIRVDNTFTGAVDNANIEQQRQMMQMQARQMYGSPEAILETLKKKAEIKDNRAKFY
ncbi:MAG TPA: peptidylprolyl isomerase [Flavisolibacter sp.]|nr:peptidylprolyl isomerase [Flavisolibacter sp.]